MGRTSETPAHQVSFVVASGATGRARSTAGFQPGRPSGDRQQVSRGLLRGAAIHRYHRIVGRFSGPFLGALLASALAANCGGSTSSANRTQIKPNPP